MASRRQYLAQSELAEYAEITISDVAETDDQISRAEELIDAYVGFQEKSMPDAIRGRFASGSGSGGVLEASRHKNVYQKDYFKYCQIEIIGGTGAGQRKIITGSTYEGAITVDSAWDTAPDSTSYYIIVQLGKFPRCSDSYFDGNVSPQIFVKSIPEAVKRATAAQVEYMITMGDDFFSGDDSNLQSESIGDYSYSRSNNASAGSNLIAPKAKQYLKGIVNRKGTMI
jgi:hypothetical protein